MNFDFVNIVTFLSVVVTALYFIHTVYETRKNENKRKNLKLRREEEMSDYEKILRSTYGLEEAREKNKGMHFDDETVYLNRAEVIRMESPLFSWINQS